jgi:hypothetical protein
MWKKFKNWWNRDEIALNERFNSLENNVTSLVTEKQALEAELNIFRTQEADDDAKRNGVEPWVEIKSDGIDPVKGMHIELDWNEAFIQYLKDNNIDGPNEDAIVQKYIAGLYFDLINKLEDSAIENTARGTVRDVVNDL